MSNSAVFQEAKKLQQSSALVELFVLDFTPFGGEYMRFFKGSFSNQNAVLWQGLEYLPFACELSGIDTLSKGPTSRPTLAMANSYGYFSTLCRQYADCVGVRFTRVRTFAKFLDDSPDADPTAFFPPDIYVINQKKAETEESVTFELISPMDLEDKSLPSRLFISNLCSWRYRSSECSYSANNVVTDGEGNEFPSSPKTARGASPPSRLMFSVTTFTSPAKWTDCVTTTTATTLRAVDSLEPTRHRRTALIGQKICARRQS